MTTPFLWPLRGHSSSKYFLASFVHPTGRCQLPPLPPEHAPSPICLPASSTSPGQSCTATSNISQGPCPQAPLLGSHSLAAGPSPLPIYPSSVSNKSRSHLAIPLLQIRLPCIRGQVPASGTEKQDKPGFLNKTCLFQSPRRNCYSSQVRVWGRQLLGGLKAQAAQPPLTCWGREQGHSGSAWGVGPDPTPVTNCPLGFYLRSSASFII